jgi:malonyl-CoA/methylmalonyl-CoA synthetase
MSDENLYSLFRSRFPRDLAAPLLLLESGGVLSYGEADAGAARYAGFFASLGLEPGDRVAVQVEKSPEALLAYLGCLRAGLAYLPLNSAYHEGEVAYFLENAEPRLVIGQPQSLAWLEPLAARLGIRHVFTLDAAGEGTLATAARSAEPRADIAQRSGDDLAAILYTSGTTGRSKGAMITHRNLASNAQVLHRAWGFNPSDLLIHMLPLFHVHGLFVACHCVLMNGTPMRFHSKFDPKLALAEFAASTVFMGVPTFYTRLLAEPGLDREACAGMRLFVSGSAPLLPETHTEFERRTGQRILERYGMTETGMLTSNPLQGDRRAGSVGPALQGTEVRVVDDADRACAPGVSGHVQVRGANVFPGYWRMPEKNREEFTPDGFFRTGDMGSLSDDGYLTIAGRSKDLIITGGYNVYPKEIELAIDDLPGVLESAVVGIPHPDFGEAVTAVVVPRPGAAQPSEEGIIATLKSRLANFKVPKRVHIVDALPRNAMGKVQKNVLRDRYSSPSQLQSRS